MHHLDGSCESKPTEPSSPPSRSTTQRSTARTCFGSLFASPAKREKARDEAHGDEEADDDSPMRIVPPRATDTAPIASTPTSKQYSSSLKLSMTASAPALMEVHTQPRRETQATVGSNVSVVTAVSHQSSTHLQEQQIDNGRKDGDGMAGSPMRDTALKSHPVNVAESSDKQT